MALSVLRTLKKRYWRWRDRRRARALLQQAERAVRGFPMIRQRQSHGLPGALIVSLTSYPKRFDCLDKTLKSLLDQNIAADQTILWIAEADLALLPRDVLDLRAHGLEIRGCSDTLSYKKLIPCLSAYPEAYIVTADDDAYYNPDWLKSLVDAYDGDDRTVIAGRAHLARFDDAGHARPYTEWAFNTRLTVATEANTAIFPTGSGGILYPPHSLSACVLDEDAFMRLCPHGDDIWFFYAQRIAGTRQRKTQERFDLISWDGTQEVALWLENMAQGQNDRQIQMLEAELGGLMGTDNKPLV